MKKTLIIIAALICLAALTFSLVACNRDGKGEDEAAAFVTVDINPSVQLTLNAEGKVLSAHGANEDGLVLLYGEDGIVGEDVETAVSNITRLAAELGWLTDATAVVETSVVADGSLQDEFLSKVNASVSGTAELFGITVSCSSDASFSLSRKLDGLKAEYPDNEDVQALTPARLKLVLAAVATGEISFEAAVELDTEALIEKVSDAHIALAEFATDAYSEAKEAAVSAFESAKSAALDAVYVSYFTLHRPFDLYYAVAYAGYNAGSVAMDALTSVLFFAEQAGAYPLDEASVTAVAELLGMEGEEIDLLKNSEGEITLDSIEAYLDKLYRSSELAEDVEAIRAEIVAELDAAEAKIRAEIADIAAEHEEEIAALKEDLAEAAQRIELAVDGILPPAVEEQINAMVADLSFLAEEAANILADGRITSSETAALRDKLAAKADDVYAAMAEELTEKEREELNGLLADAESTLSDAQTKMEQALDEAEAAAREHIAALKAQRTDNAD